MGYRNYTWGLYIDCLSGGLHLKPQKEAKEELEV